MSSQRQQASELIDLVADAMDAHDNPKDQYAAGRQVVLAYHQMNPHRHFAFRQASIYVARRMQRETA